MDWDKVVKDAARKLEAESEGAAVKARQRDVRFAEIDKTMRSTVLPVLQAASDSLRKNGYLSEIQADRGPEGDALSGLTLRVRRAPQSRRTETPSSAFELKAEPEGRTLHLSTLYAPDIGVEAGSEDVPYTQITPQWIEARLKVFVENALSGR